MSIVTLTTTAKQVLDRAFSPLWARGEVTDFKAHRNGHWYFCLRDGEATLRCVVWSRDRYGIPAPPDNGMQVTALGQLTVYAARGEMQFTIRAMSAVGDGLWRKARELIRARLEADGLLDQARKRPLPILPTVVAVVTSPDGAALRDIIAVARRRCASVQLVLVPAAVQGEGAPDDLCRALTKVARWGGADVVIVGRGGGGQDDLRAFDDERVARAIAAMPIPVVVAVGHEMDISLCDLVADLRAATPSAAAEAVVPARDQLLAALASTQSRLVSTVHSRIRGSRMRLQSVARNASSDTQALAARRRAQLDASAGRLHALSPLATLARGYAVAQGSDGRTYSRLADFIPGRRFDLRVRDGVVEAEVRDRMTAESAGR
ncbi:MAG: exodeoxyribonuclease VII large subunit [Gemmatimonadaceae bacterium]